ncbi:ferritin-like fold-containing protein, partial [Kibdelosporangium lantanae]
MAAELGLRTSLHTGSDGIQRPIADLCDHGLLRETTTYVHGNGISDEELRMLADAGSSLSISPDVELKMGFGNPLTGRAALSEMAAAEIGHYAKIEKYLVSHGVTPTVAMEPFVQHFEAFHASTPPRTWHESIVKAYVFDGLAADLYSQLAHWLDESTKELVLDVLADTGHSAFAEREIRAACETDRALRDRLTLW